MAILSKFLAIFAEHYRREVSPVNAQVYELGLADLSPDELERACALALSKCKFMPVVADIRAQLVGVYQASEWQREWALLLDHAGSYDPQTGAFGERDRICYDAAGVPIMSYDSKGRGYVHMEKVQQSTFSPEAQYAIRCLGGAAVVLATELRHLPLLCKQFAEFYQNRIAQKAAGFVMGDGQAKKVLAKVKEVAQLESEKSSPR